MWCLMVWVAGVVLLFVVASADFVWVFVFLVTCLVCCLVRFAIVWLDFVGFWLSCCVSVHGLVDGWFWRLGFDFV